MADAITRLNAALEDRYRIERQLGEGGMATVYLADDLRHERKVAVKVLKPELAAVVGAERFLAEIKTTANLQHPHILPLHDSGEADGFLFYVMPFVEGESLRQRLDREHQLPVDEAVRIATDLAEALGYAHRQGVIHRDIKPANVLLVEGKPVISDFGIALAVGAAGAGRLTETGLSLGTPHYMSPEQATGEKGVGPSSDIYALGCVLYEMLVGEPPFTGSTAQAVLGKIVTGEPDPVHEHRRSVAPNVEAAVYQALEKVPADRFARTENFAAALSDPGFRHRGAAGELVAGRRGTWRIATVAFALLFTLTAAALVSTRFSAPPSTPLVRFEVPPPEGTAYASNRAGGQVALSPDGQWLAFVTTGGTLYRRRLGELEAEPVPGAASVAVPFFSPDSRWLGYYDDRRLMKSPMTGGPSVPIAQTPAISGASWGDDDVIVFVRNTSGQLYTVPGAGGIATRVPVPEGALVRYNQPWALPGGGTALATVRGAAAEVRMVAVDLATGAWDTLGLGTRVAYAAGQLVFTGADGTLFAQPFDLEERRTTDQFVPILDGVALGHRSMGEFAVSGNGALVYLTGSLATQELIIERPGGPTVVPLPEAREIETPTFSPDGRRIAMGLGTVESQDIWIYDRNRLTPDRLTVEGSVNMVPVWTPDGERVTYMSHRDDAPQGQIYWQAADRSDAAGLLLGTDFPAVPYSWTPDGRTLAFVGIPPEGGTDIGLITLGETEPRWILRSEFTETQPRVSPDGRWITYVSDVSGELEVYVLSMDDTGGRERVSISGGRSPRWGADSHTLYFVRPSDAGGTLVAATASTEDGFEVTAREDVMDVENLMTLAGTSYDVSPDGRELVHIGRGGEDDRHLIWILNWPEIVEERSGR